MQSLCCEITVIAGQHVEHIFPVKSTFYIHLAICNLPFKCQCKQVSGQNQNLHAVKKKPNRVNKNQATDDDTKAKQKMLN